jgi:catechol 2,3-dioxygenase-like lactoylglutathione lyase family enzyme
MIDHISVGVSDLQRSATFYEAALGARAGIDADDGDEDHETEIFEHIACRVRRIAEKAQPGDQR